MQLHDGSDEKINPNLSEIEVKVILKVKSIFVSYGLLSSDCS